MDPDEYLDHVHSLIDEHGWMVQAVGDSPPFAYTVGLAAKGLPEVITLGLPHQVAHALLNTLAQHMVLDGAPEPGAPLDYLAVGYLATVITVEDSSELLTVANRIATDQRPIPALQLVFEDAEHRWPWNSDSTLAVPLLGPVPEVLGSGSGSDERRTLLLLWKAIIGPKWATRVEAHLGEECAWEPPQPAPGVSLRCVTHDVALSPPVPVDPERN